MSPPLYHFTAFYVFLLRSPSHVKYPLIHPPSCPPYMLPRPRKLTLISLTGFLIGQSSFTHFTQIPMYILPPNCLIYFPPDHELYLLNSSSIFYKVSVVLFFVYSFYEVSHMHLFTFIPSFISHLLRFPTILFACILHFHTFVTHFAYFSTYIHQPSFPYHLLTRPLNLTLTSFTRYHFPFLRLAI